MSSSSGKESGDDSTLATDVSSDFGQLSLASSNSKSPIRQRRHSVDDDVVRTKYLHRLGFEMSSSTSEHGDDAGAGSNTSSHRKALSPCISGEHGHARLSSSLDDRLLIPTPRQRSKRQERLILLRRSERYTVNLKFDESSDEVTKPKFELSSAWTNFLSSSFNASEPSQSSNQEPLDGAYDLFSLPSDSSFNMRPISSDSATDMACSADSQVTTPSLLRRESSRTSRGELSNLSASASRRPPRKVSFDSTVIATTIPSRFSYSDRIRSRLWSSTDDINANAIRNEHELIYEQWMAANEEGKLSQPKSIPSSSGQLSALEQPHHSVSQSEHSQPMPVAAHHYEETDIFDSGIHTSVLGEERDEDDAFETGVFAME